MDIKVESCVRGHKVYSTRWNSVLGKVLICKRELDNTTDRYAVAVLLNNKRRRYPEIFQQRQAINCKLGMR